MTCSVFLRDRLLALVVASLLAASATVGRAAEAVLPNQVRTEGATQQPVSVSPVKEKSNIEVVRELDPYYSDIGLNIPLTDKPVPTIRSDNEAVIYRDLITGSLIPRYMVVEASVNPVPWFASYLKSHSPNSYDQVRIGGVNLLESATIDFQEPWALAAFFGNVAKLERPGEKRSGENYGYTGYLVSTGNKHIKDNLLVDDNWYELEWKIKGKLDYPDEKLSWSFRAGGKFHGNPNITNVVYLSLYRSNMNLRLPFLEWMNNSNFNLKLHFSQQDRHLIREELVVGRKFPGAYKGYTPTLDIGMVWASPEEYSGVLRTRTRNSVTFLLRPSVEF